MTELTDTPVFKAFLAWATAIQFDIRFNRDQEGNFDYFVEANAHVAWLAFRDGWRSCEAHAAVPKTNFLKGATV